MEKANQDKTRQVSAHIGEEMETPSCTAELKLATMRLKDNRFRTTKRIEQLLLMITKKEEDLTLGLRTLTILISNPDTEIRAIRHPIDKLASTQIGTEIHTQIDSMIMTDQAAPGTTNQITDSKLSITSMLDHRVPILNTTKTFHRATFYLQPIQFNLLMIRNKLQ